MNAQKLWRGTDYAFGYRRKGGPMPVNAERVKVLEVIKKPIYGKDRDRTYVKIQRLLDDGMPNPRYPEPTEVTAREILEFWDEYFGTVEDEREEHKRREEEAEIKRQEAAAKRRETDAVYFIGNFLRGSWAKEERRRQAEKERIEKEIRDKRYLRLKNVLVGRGLHNFTVNEYNGSITILIEDMERWLGFGEHSA